MDDEGYTYIVIDDRADVREMVKGAFSELGCECVGEAADGPSGADLYFVLRYQIPLAQNSFWRW